LDSLKPGVPVYQVVPVGGGRALLLLSSRSIYRLDLTTRQLVDSAPRITIYGSPCLSPDGRRLYHTDFGNGFDYPGGGRVQVYDETLQVLAPIDLGSAEPFPPTLNNCAVSRDGRYLFVSSGTWKAGPLYPVQPGRLFVVDRSSGRLVRTVNIGDWLSRDIFAF
jgi:sugar lactone lactonase YvrE